MKPIIWHGCYEERWNGVIIPEAFAHPAKFSKALIERILRHGLDAGWWSRGDMIGDPFGGIASGGIMSAYAGLRWVGVELEAKFVDLGNQNIAMHARRFDQLGDPQPVLLQGDSRRFAEIVGGVAGVITSPPYAETLSLNATNGIDFTKAKEGGKTKTAARGAVGMRYGETEGQIRALPAGTVAGVVTSPPWEQGLSLDRPNAEERRRVARERGISNAEHISPIEMEKLGARHEGDYGQTIGQIGNLSGGSVDAIVTSPPYADTAVEKASAGINIEKQWETYRASGGGMSLENFREQQARHSHGYSASDGQIAALKSGTVDCVVTSPPFSQPETRDRSPVQSGIMASAITLAYTVDRQGKTEGNIAALPVTGLDGVVTSPPFADSDTKPTKLGKGKGTRKDGDGAGRNKGDYHYGESEGQIGTLKADGLESCFVGYTGLQSVPCSDAKIAAGVSDSGADGASVATGVTSDVRVCPNQSSTKPELRQDTSAYLTPCSSGRITSSGEAAAGAGGDSRGEYSDERRLIATATGASDAEPKNNSSYTTGGNRRKRKGSGTTGSRISKRSAEAATGSSTASDDHGCALSASVDTAIGHSGQSPHQPSSAIISDAERGKLPRNINGGSIGLWENSFAENATHPSHVERDALATVAMSAPLPRANENSANTPSDSTPQTYWSEMKKVYEQCRLAIKPGGILVVVVKDYVKAKKIVPLCDQTLELLTRLGFTPVARIHAMLVRRTSEPALHGGEIVTTKERKSFFRRLAEKKGSPRIDWEEVIVVRNPSGGAA